MLIKSCGVTVNQAIYKRWGNVLSNKVCVITGAASRRGIGRAIAKLFALHGGRSIILDLNAGQAWTPHPSWARPIAVSPRCDRQGRLRHRHRGVVSEFGQVDVLINKPAYAAAEAHGHRPENYDAVLDVNLRGTLYMSQAAIPQMRKQRSGSIVCMSSVSASAAAASSAARTTAPPRPAYWVWPRPWRANWVRTASASTRSPPA